LNFLLVNNLITPRFPTFIQSSVRI